MTKLILVRHGESVANFDGVFTGQSNLPLTDRGFAQAKAAAEYLKTNEKISRVYASPLKRAYDTGCAIANACGAKLIPCEDLMEINAGEWEGKRFDDLVVDYADSYSLWINDIGKSHPDGGETPKELFERCIKAVNTIVKQNPDSTVVLATHATPIRVLTAHWSGVDIADLKNVPWSLNASITEICYNTEGRFFDLKSNLKEHLIGIETVLAGNV